MRALTMAVICLSCAAPAFGQAQHPADLEPGVNTSALPAQPAQPAAAPGPASSAAVAAPVASPAADSAPAAANAAHVPGKSKAPPVAGKPAKGGKAVDRIDLDTTDITGNKELPKVMYVVPWKRADLGDLAGKPVNSLVDEVLQPVDRDVFNREERYYDTVAPEKSSQGTPPGVPAAP